jgi:hypothetical protein
MESTLSEEWLLLALEPDGRLSPWWSFSAWSGLAGAAMIDLAARDRLRVEGRRVVPTGAGATGEPPLDAALRVIEGAPRPRSADRWITSLPRKADDLRILTGRALVGRGLAREETSSFLGFRRVRFPPRAEAVAAVAARLRAAAGGQASATARDAALLRLLDAVGWLGDLIPKWAQRREARARLDAHHPEDPVSAAVARAVRAMMDGGAAVAVIAATSAGA